MDDFQNNASSNALWAINPSSQRLVPLGGAVAGIAAPQQAGPTPPRAGVPQACNNLDLWIGTVAALAAELSEKLDRAGVLKPVPPRDARTAQAGPPNFNCSFANAIDAQVQRLQLLASGIQELQERIDL